MYYIASLAKFGNRCSTVWARRQDQWEGNNYSLSFRRMRTKIYALFLQRIFYPRLLRYFWVSQHQYVLLLWWSDIVATVLRPLNSVVQNKNRINFCLYCSIKPYMRCMSSTVGFLNPMQACQHVNQQPPMMLVCKLYFLSQYFVLISIAIYIYKYWLHIVVWAWLEVVFICNKCDNSQILQRNELPEFSQPCQLSIRFCIAMKWDF